MTRLRSTETAIIAMAFIGGTLALSCFAAVPTDEEAVRAREGLSHGLGLNDGNRRANIMDFALDLRRQALRRDRCANLQNSKRGVGLRRWHVKKRFKFSVLAPFREQRVQAGPGFSECGHGGYDASKMRVMAAI